MDGADENLCKKKNFNSLVKDSVLSRCYICLAQDLCCLHVQLCVPSLLSIQCLTSDLNRDDIFGTDYNVMTMLGGYPACFSSPHPPFQCFVIEVLVLSLASENIYPNEEFPTSAVSCACFLTNNYLKFLEKEDKNLHFSVQRSPVKARRKIEPLEDQIKATNCMHMIAENFLTKGVT